MKGMKKFLVTLSVLAVVTTITAFGHMVYAQNGDLCGGTGGNGEIVSVGSNTFILNEGGERGSGNLVVNLTSRTTIETSTGFVSLSDLKIGDRVTLVGDKHRDGTFTADAVVVCNATEEIGSQSEEMGQAVSLTVQNRNSESYEKVSGVVNMAMILLIGLVWLGIVAFLLLKKKKSLVYVLFFTIFYIYLYKVLDYTLLQFQSLLLLQYFVPDLMLNGFRDGTNINLIPLATLTLEDVKTSLLNILMLLPFGFGLPFVTNFRFKKVMIAGLLFSIGIELAQLITGFMAHTTFRVADVNDLIFNTLGVVVGYILFAQFLLVFRRIFSNWEIIKNPILRYIAARPQIQNVRDTSFE